MREPRIPAEGPKAPDFDPEVVQAVKSLLLLIAAPWVNAKVRQLREAGGDDAEIRKTVFSLTIDRTQQFNAYGIDMEYHRETVVATFQRAIEDALAVKPPATLHEAGRRLEGWAEGAWIILADGHPWSFPILSLKKEPRTLNDGRIDLQYPWTWQAWGLDLFKKAIHLTVVAGDPAAASRTLFEIGCILLRQNYRLEDDECHRLMPLSIGDAVCWGELAATFEIDAADALIADRQLAFGMALVELITRIMFDLGTLVTPLVRDINSRRS